MIGMKDGSWSLAFSGLGIILQVKDIVGRHSLLSCKHCNEFVLVQCNGPGVRVTYVIIHVGELRSHRSLPWV